MRKITHPDAAARYVREFGLDDICGERTIAGMSLYAFDKGESICSAGVAMSHLYILVRGKLKVYSALPNGKAVLLRFYEPLGIIGDMEWATGYPPRSSVETLTDCLMLVISYGQLTETSSHDPTWLRYMMKHMALKLYANSNTLSLNLLYPVENRVASYLLSVASGENPGVRVGEIRTPKLLEIAELIGTSYRHLNRILARLAADGMIERRRGAIGIRDVERLKKLAEGLLYD